MVYGQNILSTVPADWVVTNGELTSSTMTLHANGSALLNITIDMIDKLPETAEVTVVASTYSIKNRVEVIAVLQDNTYIAHTLPIVDVGNGIYKTIIDFPEEPYSSFIFKVSSKEGVEVTEWSMATPVSADFTEVIDGVKQEIPKLLWDYNTLEFQIGQEECTVGMISARLKKNGDLQGHLQINFTASEDSTIVVRISDNEIQELYSPIEFNVKRGRNAIGIPHAYIGRKIGIHNFLVTMQIKTGTATVETRGFLYTIDGGYLAQRILDVGYEVHDITIKQLPTDMDPSEIYAVCIDDGKALIRKRVYNEEVAVAWVPEYIIEDAVEACIEFNGLWILRDGEIGFTLETDEQPYVMWIDSAGVLWSQHGPDVSTKFQMAEGVSYMSCCMSYNYAPDIQYDQGLMCIYIKSGVVYYKNLCRQDLVGTLVWSAEREITLLGSGNTLVSVARLNDYRCAINAINSKSQWLISDRGYVGQATRLEHSYVSLRTIALTRAQQTSIIEHQVATVEEITPLSSTSIRLAVSTHGIDAIAQPTLMSYDWVENCVTFSMSHQLHNLGDSDLSQAFKCMIKGVPVLTTINVSGNNLIVQLLADAAPLTKLTVQATGNCNVICLQEGVGSRLFPSTILEALNSKLDFAESIPLAIPGAITATASYLHITETTIAGQSDSTNFGLVQLGASNIVVTQIGTTPV